MDYQKQNTYLLAYLYNSLFLFILSIIIFFLAIPTTQFKNFQFFGFLFGFVSFVVAIIFLLKFLRFKKGEEGEKIVNGILKKLYNYDLFNNVHISNYGDVDHLLVYKNNIFVIETKNYSGNVEVYGDDWYVNGNKIKSPSIQIKKSTAKLKEILDTKIWLNCVIVPIIDGNLNVKNSTVDIVTPNDLIHFINNRKGIISDELLLNFKDKIKQVQLSSQDKISLKGILNNWWFSNYKRFFIFGLIYGLVYLINTKIFIFIINKFYNINIEDYLPKYTLTEDILAIFYVGILSVLFGKIIFDIFKIDLKIELFNVTAMIIIGSLPFFIYDLFTLSDSIGQLAEIISRLIAILISYSILKMFKFDLTHMYLR